MNTAGTDSLCMFLVRSQTVSRENLHSMDDDDARPCAVINSTHDFDGNYWCPYCCCLCCIIHMLVTVFMYVVHVDGMMHSGKV